MFLQPRYVLLMAQLQLRRKTSQVMSLVLRMIAALRRRMPLIRHLLLHLKRVVPLPLKRKNPATSLVQMMIPLALQLSQRRRVVLRNLLRKMSPLKKKRMKNHRELPRSKRPLLLLKLKLRDQKHCLLEIYPTWLRMVLLRAHVEFVTAQKDLGDAA
uniref:Uncharacterized protein isoform X2 n=1 Tax=Nicotiana tabacum TaxID=4097 RepID=A0A1S3YCX0_TOBAC|nr:PREDICTED: uncharacterized protein LOC107774728 isoform X2 [Nicotiana tabacum]